MRTISRKELCWSRGPRIGSDGHPYCLKLAGHKGAHESHPESGYSVSWGGELCRASPSEIRSAWLPVGYLDNFDDEHEQTWDAVETNNQAAIVAAVKAGNPDMPVAHTETWARDIGGWLDQAGYALVKLPGEEVDEWGSTHWAVEGDRFSQVKIGHDGRISVLGVPFAMTDPAQAISLAAALLAAAQYIKDENQ